MCIIWNIYIDYIQVISRLYCVHKLLLNFQSSKNSNNSKKNVVNNVQLLQNHCHYSLIH
jgi:hypothetical protein